MGLLEFLGRRRTARVLAVAGALALMGVVPALAQTETGPPKHDADKLAKTLANPIASLVSIPIQNDWNENVGLNNEGRQYVFQLQPVLPFKLNDDWNLITRVIVPIIGQPVLIEGVPPTFGAGDITPSFFFSPARGRLIWGVGPAFNLPVTSDPFLGSGKYSMGPTGVALMQEGHWTFGALVNQFWSVGGDTGRGDVNQLFLEPFISWSRDGWTFSVNSESTLKWKEEGDARWQVPINVDVSKLIVVGHRPISVKAGPRFYASRVPGGPNWGFRISLTLLFPLAH